MKVLELKHPLTNRWLHWISFPLLFLMVWSGLLIYWSNDIYRIGVGQTTVFHFFPDWVYRVLHLDHRLAEGMAIHFAFMWLFALNGVLFVIYHAISGEWRYLVPDRHAFREAMQVTLHDLGLSKYHPPVIKYNGAQKIAYSSVIVMGAVMLITGLAIYKPTQTAWLTALCGGYEMARWLHFWTTIGFLVFFVIHIAQVVRAGWGNFRSMITGYEVVEKPQEAHGD